MKNILFLFLLLPLEVYSQGIISTIAGTGLIGYSGDGGPATNATFSFPLGICVDGMGNVFIVDHTDNVVRKISSSTGVISTVVGNGTMGYSGDGGPATNASLHYADHICLDNAGNIYITEVYNCVIRKVTIATGVISTVAGTPASGYSGDGGPATSARLNSPAGIFVDKMDNLYIADAANDVIRKVTASTGIISTIAGTYSGFSGDGGPALMAKLNNPYSVFVDTNGNIIIADADNKRIRKVSASTGIISTIAGTGGIGYTGDGGPATAAPIPSPVFICGDNYNNIYISDGVNKVIRKISGKTEIISTVAGNGTTGFSGDGGPATNAQISSSVGIFVDKMQNIFFIDYNNVRVRKITNPSLALNTVAASECVKIYPNPVSLYLTVTCSSTLTNVLVLDFCGKIIKSIDCNMRKLDLDVSDLPAGIYFVKANNSEAMQFVKQ